MDKLRAMEVFVRIVDGRSLTNASEALGTSLPSVVRTLAALERMLDVRLLNRTTRRMALTDEGREYYERCKQILAAADEAQAALSARRVAPKGRLRISAPVMFGRLRVMPLVTQFLAAHPSVQIELLLLDRVIDLVEEGVDAAVRVGALPDSSLVAIPVGETRRVVCATPAYLRKAGRPRSPADLASHRCVNFGGLAPSSEWTFGAGRAVTRMTLQPAFASNQIDPALEACLQGVGIGQFLCYQVQDHLDARRLSRVLSEFEPAPMPIHLIYPHARLLSANVRAFVDWAVPRLPKRMSIRSPGSGARPSDAARA